MNTKEAIEALRISNYVRLSQDETDDIITLLMRGSAFEKMFREVENMYGSSLTWEIEQKYFPTVEETYNVVPVSEIKVGGTD